MKAARFVLQLVALYLAIGALAWCLKWVSDHPPRVTDTPAPPRMAP